jgi:phenylacetate-coenzyme A ligase PaaK-like adenylate-forming protein
LKQISNIEKQIFEIKSEFDFIEATISIFQYQYKNNLIYKTYVDSLGIKPESIININDIPFLPIDFFKSKNIICGEIKPETICFSSSGTTGQITSKHYVNSISIYQESFSKGFQLFYGDIKDYCVLALLPSYLEREGSSLVFMANQLIKDSNHLMSGFYLNNLDELVNTISELKKLNQKTILLGVSYALLDLADKNIQLNENFIVMETGGMKGKREELTKEELHNTLKEKFKINNIHSEYGMTELLSQSYSIANGKFKTVPWKRILVRDVNDPFSYVTIGKTGGINVIDLANIYSCSFIETKDLGKLYTDNSFEIVGRFDVSDLRGCNLLIQ